MCRPVTEGLSQDRAPTRRCTGEFLGVAVLNHLLAAKKTRFNRRAPVVMA